MSIINNMIKTHQCRCGDHPRWMVYGWMRKNNSDSFGVQYWIKPSDQDEFIARKIAQLLNKDKNNNVLAEKTEWHPQIGPMLPLYQKPGHINDIIKLGR